MNKFEEINGYTEKEIINMLLRSIIIYLPPANKDNSTIFDRIKNNNERLTYMGVQICINITEDNILKFKIAKNE